MIARRRADALVTAPGRAQQADRRHGRPRRGPGRDRGSASLWVLACCCLLLLVAAAATLRGLAGVLRARAEAAADLAALAAAAQIGVDPRPCTAAVRIAALNRARLLQCHVRLDASGRSGAVSVGVAVSARLPVVGERQVNASARAARLPGSTLGRLGRSPEGRVVASLPRPCSHGPTHVGPARDERWQRVDVSVSRPAHGDVPVVAVSGEVDVYSAPVLKESLTGLLKSGDVSVVVDLTEVAFLDSTGLGALVEARAATSEVGGSLPLVCNQERILKLFTITGLDGVFSIHTSVDDAVADVSG